MGDGVDLAGESDDERHLRWGPAALIGRLRIRAKLYLAFLALSGLVLAFAVGAIAWTSRNDARLLRNVALLELAKLESTVVELKLMTMSDAMRGYLIDTANQAELRRKFAADEDFARMVEELKVTLANMPSVLRLVTELNIYDDQHLNIAEDRLVEIAKKDIDAAKRYYKTDYLPRREHEIGMILGLRQEVARVEAAERDKAAQTYARQLIIGLSAIVAIVLLSGSLAWLCARAIGEQIRAMTDAMGRLADGDTLVEIPARHARDEIGDMARALEVFRSNLIAKLQGADALRRVNLQFDAALNSMLQGMLVFDQNHLLQLVNSRFFVITGMPEGSVGPGMTVRALIDIAIGHGLYEGQDPADVADKFTSLVGRRRSMQSEQEMRDGLFVQIAGEPMANGGAVVTFEDVTEKRQQEAQIVFMARHDALTGLPNRTMFKEQLETLLGEGANGQMVAVLCLDLDHFKEVNDTIGHPAGDELLRLVAARLRNCVRDHDMIARLGGDEFAIVVTTPSGGPELAASLAARLVESIGAPYDIQGCTIVIGASIGIAVSGPGVSGADMLKRADVALYRAKEDRGCYAFFEPGMDALLQARRGMEADLRLAVQRREFELHCQPLYNLQEDRVTAFEALIRWNSPTRGRVAPVDFIPLAEQTGLIVAIGEWVLRTACEAAVPWPEHVRVAVNLSPVQTKGKHLVALVRETLAQTGLPARRLELEITETVLLQDTEAVMTMQQDLHEVGV